MSDRLSAVIKELEHQRNTALTRCAELAGTIADLRAQLDALQQRIVEEDRVEIATPPHRRNGRAVKPQPEAQAS